MSLPETQLEVRLFYPVALVPSLSFHLPGCGLSPITVYLTPAAHHQSTHVII